MEGRFVAKWNFKCQYCSKTVWRGSTAYYILKHEKKACEDCHQRLLDKFYGKDVKFYGGE